MRLIIAVLLFSCWSEAIAARSMVARPVPLPPARPADLVAPTAPSAPTAGPEASACFQHLKSLADATRLEPITGPGECGAPDVVRLDAVLGPDGRKIVLSPAPILRCTMAEAVVEFLRDDVPPVALSLGAPVKEVDNYDSFECRGRNRIAGAKISEHGHANALDIRSVTLANGRRLELTDPAVDRPFRESLRARACARFTTVLGPGSDGYHENHVHVDLAERHNGYRICQWDVRTPDTVPLPPQRPAEPIQGQ
jgi:hypothetical protein